MSMRLRHIEPVPGSPGSYVTATGWAAALLALFVRVRPRPTPDLADVLATGRPTGRRMPCGCEVWRMPRDPRGYVPHVTGCPQA